MTTAKTTLPAGTVQFSCPNCLKETIVRTPHQRKIAAKYVCTCGFEGPN